MFSWFYSWMWPAPTVEQLFGKTARLLRSDEASLEFLTQGFFGPIYDLQSKTTSTLRASILGMRAAQSARGTTDTSVLLVVNASQLPSVKAEITGLIERRASLQTWILVVDPSAAPRLEIGSDSFAYDLLIKDGQIVN